MKHKLLILAVALAAAASLHADPEPTPAPIVITAPTTPAVQHFYARLSDGQLAAARELLTQAVNAGLIVLPAGVTVGDITGYNCSFAGKSLSGAYRTGE